MSGQIRDKNASAPQEPYTQAENKLVVGSHLDPQVREFITNLQGQVSALYHSAVLESNNISDRHLAGALDQIATTAKRCRNMLNPT